MKLLQSCPNFRRPLLFKVVFCAMGLAYCSYLEARSDVDIASLSLDELMDVEVTTPGKVPEAIRDTPASVYLVSRNDIETFGYRSLTEVLENVPGFYNIDNYTGVSGNLGVRGHWNGRSQNSSVAILVNGVPQMRPDIFAAPMEGINVPVEAIDRIEVSRGPNSVFYGNGAFFGAVNIITNDSYSDDLLSVSVGSNDTTRVAGRVSEFGENFYLIVNAGLSKTNGLGPDLLDLVGPDRMPLLPSYGVTEGNTSLDGRLENESGFLQLSGAWHDFYFDYSFNDADVESFSGFPSVEGGNLRSSQISRLLVGADFQISDKLRLDSNLTYMSFDSEERYDALYPGFYGINTREFENWEFEGLLTFEQGDTFRFVGGVNLQRLQNFKEYTHIPDVGVNYESVVIDERDLGSLFGQVSFKLSDQLRFVAGYRVEEMKLFDRYVYAGDPDLGTPLPGPPQGDFQNGTPRVSLIYQPDESQVWKLMIGDAIKIPNFSHPNFETEKTRTSEINYTWSGEGKMISASLFKNSLSDLLIQTLDVAPNGVVDTNLLNGGEVDTTGVEFLVRSSFTDTVSAELGLTWQDSDSAEHPDGLLSYSPELVAHGKVTYKRGDFAVSGLARYVDDMVSFYDKESVGSGFFSDGYFGDPVDSYIVADMNLRWDDIWEGMYIDVHVTNVFDKEIRYPNNPINGLLIDRGTLAYGRRFDLTAGFRF